MRYLGLLFLVQLTCNIIVGQNSIVVKNFEKYDISNGLKSSSTTSATINNQGLLYISNSSGVHIFDGSQFVNFTPENINFGSRATVYVSKENHLYVIAKGIIYKFNTSEHKSLQAKLKIPFDENVSAIILNENEQELWLYNVLGQVFIIDKINFTIIANTHKRDLFKSNIYGTITPQNSKDEVLLYQREGLVKVSKKENSINFLSHKVSNFKLNNFLQLESKEFLYLSQNRLYKGPMNSTSEQYIGSIGKVKQPLRSTINAISKNEYLITYDNEVYIYNNQINSITQLVKNKEGDKFFENGPIATSCIDGYQNIYLFSLAEGFVKIVKPSGIVKSLKDENIKANFISALYYDSEEQLLISGSLRNGIKIYNKNYLNTYTDNSLQTPITIWKSRSNEYYYTVMENKNIYFLRKVKGGYRTGVIDKTEYVSSFYSNTMLENNDKIIFNNGMYIGKIIKEKSSKSIDYIVKIPGNKSNSYYTSLYEDKIYLGGFNEITLLDTSFAFIKKYQFDDKGNVRKLLRRNSNEIFIGSEKGLELYDNNLNFIKTYYLGTVYSIVSTKNGRIWCGTNNGLICLHNESIIYFNKGDGLTCNEYNGNCAIYTNNGKLIFGGIGGIDIFDEESLLNLNSTPDCVLSEIIINDEKDIAKYYNEQTLVLPHNKSFLNFKLSPLGPGDIKSYIIKYRMKGINDQWVNGFQSRSVSYQLQPGNYQFQYSASKNFDTKSEIYKTLNIKVLPPFYKSWWFIVLASILFLLIVFYIFSLINKIKYEQKKSMWEVKEKLLTQRSEFSRELHDLIGSQVGIVTRNIDYILDQNKKLPEDKMQAMLIQTLGLSKQIAKDVRDTIWASNKDVITLKEFISRLKDHTYYYQHLPMSINLENRLTDESKSMQPIEGLNLYRILQEAIHNAQKHSGSLSLSIIFEDSPFFQIHIIDKGIGINYQSNKSEGRGIENMLARAEKINYSLTFDSDKKGTHLKIKKNEKI